MNDIAPHTDSDKTAVRQTVRSVLCAAATGPPVIYPRSSSAKHIHDLPDIENWATLKNRLFRPFMSSALLVAAAFVILTTMFGCTKGSVAAPQSPTVLVSHPLERKLIGWDTYTGRFEATDTVEVRSRVAGYIDQVAFRDGDFVKKKDLLFVIDPRPYQAIANQARGRLEDARSRLQLTKLDLARAESLIASGTISTSLYDQRKQAHAAAVAGVITAEGSLERARLDLEFTRVLAPMPGRISRKLVSPGNLVAGGDANGTLLTTIVSVDPIELYFDIDEESYLRYGQQTAQGKRKSAGNVGSDARITLPGQSSPSRVGEIDFTENRLDRSTGTLRARARVPNADHLLNPGQFARVEIVGDAVHTALLVPDSAITTDATRRVLNVVSADQRIEVRPIAIGKLFGQFREITDGLRPGDLVIVSGLQRAQVGEKVTPQLTQIDATQLASLGSAP
jgi:RND family efflux transporter MFP subunit